MLEYYDEIKNIINTNSLYLFPCVSVILGFVVALLIAVYVKSIQYKVLLGVSIAIGFYILATQTERSPIYERVCQLFYSLGAEVLGGLLLIGLAPLLRYAIAGLLTKDDTHNPMTVWICYLYMLFLSIISYILVKRSDDHIQALVFSNEVENNIISTLGVEILASTIISIVLIVMLLIVVLIYYVDAGNTTYVIKGCIGFLCVEIILIYLFSQIRDYTFADEFPTNFKLAIAGAILGSILAKSSASVSNLFPETLGFIFRILFIVLPVIFLFMNRSADDIGLSLLSECFGLAIVTALLDTHAFSKQSSH